MKANEQMSVASWEGLRLPEVEGLEEGMVGPAVERQEDPVLSLRWTGAWSRRNDLHFTAAKTEAQEDRGLCPSLTITGQLAGLPNQ